jgi:hypothetical protein
MEPKQGSNCERSAEAGALGQLEALSLEIEFRKVHQHRCHKHRFKHSPSSAPSYQHDSAPRVSLLPKPRFPSAYPACLVTINPSP